MIDCVNDGRDVYFGRLGECLTGMVEEALQSSVSMFCRLIDATGDVGTLQHARLSNAE